MLVLGNHDRAAANSTNQRRSKLSIGMEYTAWWICSNQLNTTSVIHDRRAPAGLKTSLS